MFAALELFNDIRITATPTIRQTLTIFDPKTFPMATPPVCPYDKAAIIETHNSGKDVEKPTKKNPTVVFPNPVILETFTALVIVTWLALFKITNEMNRSTTLAIMSHAPDSKPSNNTALSFFYSQR
jgi:hypothetical protein